MQTANDTAAVALHPATLVRTCRITPESSPEDVRQLVFATEVPGFDAGSGHCVRVMAPGQFGNRYHPRFYSIADLDKSQPGRSEFSLLVRRCSYIDEFSGERYAGVASNWLCDLPIGAGIEFAGPVGHPFSVPTDPTADLLMIGMGTGIAPFRSLVRRIYEMRGGWHGRVRLFYGARSGLEMLYMNDENRDLANYYDRATFKAFQAVSPRPHFGEPAALDRALADNAAEVWEMMQKADTHVYVAGPQVLLATVEKTLVDIAGSGSAWASVRHALATSGRWNEVLY